MNFVCKVVIAAGIFCGLSLSSVRVAGQTASLQSPRSMVSDWTHHYVLYPQSNDVTLLPRIENDPRWVQSFYLHHPEQWWPGVRTHRRHRRVHRDWSVPLGTAYYEPLFDSTFTFSIGPQGGSGILTSADLGNGQLLATAGTLTVSAGSNLGSYDLYPGGAGPTVSPSR